MGSPAFSVSALHKLFDSSDHQVVCVYTRAPRPSGRGKRTQITPVHSFAQKHNIPVRTPTTLRGENVSSEADMIVISAYGMLLPRSMLESTKYGCVNIHPSLLPRWRGAAPIQHAILSGDKKTGVCIMRMTEGLDEGDVFSMQEIDISEVDDYQSVHDKLAMIGSELLLDVIDNIESIIPVKQSDLGMTYAAKIQKELLDWDSNSAFDIVQKIKALQSVDCILNNKRVKILKARSANYQHDFQPGDIINEKLHVACRDGVIVPEILQAPGKTAIYIDDFVRGKYLY